jgi:uncharacterized circularly permuted ATP-grasp superfamily protein
MQALAPSDLDATPAAVQATLAERGVAFGSGDDASPFVVDPVPRVIEADEWALLRPALAQRAQALAAFVADVYGERSIVSAGVLPARVIETAEYLEPDLEGLPPASPGWVAGLDLVRGEDGRLRVLEDNFRTPSGIAYAIAAREAIDPHLPVDPPANRLDPMPVFTLLADALRGSAPPAVERPNVVLVSDGPSNSAWYEHRTIASRLGLPIVLPQDLSLGDGRLWARIEGRGVEAVDVVYRRTDEDRLRTPEGDPTWLAELLLEPLRSGSVAVVNPLGAGIADDKLAHAYVEDMIRFYRDEEPLIESVRTYDLCEERVFECVMPRLDELVVKPRGGHGGEGVVVCPHATAADRDRVRRRVAEHPDRYVAQEVVQISTQPTVCDGRLEQRHVDLRPFVVGSGGSAVTAPVALTRVAFDEGSLVVSSSQNGGGKDTWLLS